MSALLAPFYRVVTAADGREALERARTQAPDIILSDVMMPHMTGLELVQALRADPSTVAIPIILLSARAGEEATVEGLDSGSDDYLTKPFTAQELLARVRSHVKLAQARRQWTTELELANRELDAIQLFGRARSARTAAFHRWLQRAAAAGKLGSVGRRRPAAARYSCAAPRSACPG